MTLTTAPTLTTARLTLRAHAPSDLAACLALWSDPLVVRYIGGQPATEEQCWARVLRYIGHWAAQGYGFWIAHDTATGALVGEVGVADFKRELAPALRCPHEAGWVLVPAAHGRGLATEAMRAVLAWTDARLAAPRTTCVIERDNAASVAVATKCGFHEHAVTVSHGAALVVYERLTAPRA